MTQDGNDRFTHEKLQAYVVAREFLGLAQQLVKALPRGEGELGDQLKRAALSVLLNTAEGAGRRAVRDTHVWVGGMTGHPSSGSPGA